MTEGAEGLAKGVFIEPEIRLAMRNHGMPLEALCYDLTPPGLHYLLTHFDIPAVDADTWTLEVAGLVNHPLEAVDCRPSRTAPGGAHRHDGVRRKRPFGLDQRPVSQPWVLEAIGTSRWAGVPVSALLERAGVKDGAIEVVFSALDQGIDGGVEQHFERSLPLELAESTEPIVAISMNGGPVPPSTGSRPAWWCPAGMA